MTKTELLPFLLCLRFGIIHPDYLMPRLTAGQYLDWVRVHRQINIGIDRDDINWGLARAEFHNANFVGEGDMPIEDPREVMPYIDPEELFEDDWGPEQLLNVVRSAKVIAEAAKKTRI